MNQLKVVSINGQLVTDSRNVAKLTDRRHSDLMRTIAGYEIILTNAKVRSSNFFSISSYPDAKGELRNCYLLTKKGCDMIANKMTGEKGVLFTAAYVTKFEEMEKRPRILSEKEQLRASMKLSLETSEEVEEIRKDVSVLKNTMRIDGVQEFQIRKKANHVVVKCLGGKKTLAYKEMSNKLFARFWRDFKDHFTIPRYGELPKVKFDEAIEFIYAWQPDTSTRLEIKSSNSLLTNSKEVI